MRGTVILLLFLITTLQAQNWQLVWSDEFDGPSIDYNNWTREIGGGGWGNNELQYYTISDANAYIENGVLVIKAIKENYSGYQYTSARLKTQGKRFFKYGKIEARIKMPFGKGIWPAFWMLGENITSVGWPKCGEIDIAELVGGGNGDRTIYGTAHWDDNGHTSNGGNYYITGQIFADAFHIFSITWDTKKIVWYVDGIQYHSLDITPSTLSEMHKDFFILLNVAVGGNWPGYPNSSTVFPQTMEIDYVRVYENVASVPQVSLIDPVDNSSFNPGTDITLKADVQLENSTVKGVEFYQGSAVIGYTEVAPYEIKWRNVQAGCYTVKAKAYSNEGTSGISNEINIMVGNGCPQSSYVGYNHYIPGKIEAEDYDLGGSGISYQDSDDINSGGSYRNDGVDIEECSDIGGGYNVGWINSGEWLEYSVYVSKSASYDVVFRASSTITGGKISMQIDGVPVLNNVNITSTGDWQSWSDFSASGIQLVEGEHILRLYFDNGLFNLNNFTIFETGTGPSINLITPAGGETYGIETIQEIRWISDRVNTVKIGLSTNGGGDWSFVSSGTDAKYGSYRWSVPNQLSDNCYIMIIAAEDFNIKDMNSSAFTITDAVGVKDESLLNNKFELFQNYPNPFNPSTTIKYSLPSVKEADEFGKSINSSSQWVKLEVYDMLGRKVSTLVNKPQTAGIYSVVFNASNLGSGIYIYKLQYGNLIAGKKFILLK